MSAFFVQPPVTEMNDLSARWIFSTRHRLRHPCLFSQSRLGKSPFPLPAGQGYLGFEQPSPKLLSLSPPCRQSAPKKRMGWGDIECPVSGLLPPAGFPTTSLTSVGSTATLGGGPEDGPSFPESQLPTSSGGLPVPLCAVDSALTGRSMCPAGASDANQKRHQAGPGEGALANNLALLVPVK